NEIINQIENSIIAENPYSTLEIAENDLVISTPQKIIDNQIKSKYQFWLDISSDEWIKSDTGPLYNAWVFQRGWAKDEFTIDDNIELSKEKTARILRKLTLCASEHVYTYSSLFDGNGIENFGGIEEYIKIKEQIHTEETKKAFKIIPRDDQKPVLEYETGKMAISAVPGAGKTTILLALILKLLDNGVNPENIFVMTYMESATRNFRDRIKNIRQNSSQLPNISTIHGLALRILKENGNFERLGLSSDFEICDDTQRSRIIREIANKLKLKKTETDEFDRGISVFKIGNGQFQSGMDKKLEKFQMFFEEYQRILKEANLIDYDDMLTSSVKLLEDNADIRAYYQDICHYIIEDEAQDSSSIQQRLINLLSAKHKNLIRCGDINQAITTTFSNADVEGFRKFISESNNVSMNCSQRCTKDVWTLANNLVKWADTQQETKNAFFEIFMQPVEGRNPVSENALHAVIFEKPLEERNYILKEIKSALKKNPKCTIGILLRSNYQVAQWINFINNSGLKSITRSESLEQKSIFRTIFAVMQMILHPFDNNVIADNYEILAEMGLYKQRLGLEIRKYENPFIQIDCDNIENIYLAQFYWDLTYWLSFPHLAAEELAIKIGLHYFNSEIEKSNVYLISTLIKRLSLNYKDFPTLIERLGELAKKPSLSGFKFFSEEDESDKEFLAGKVQIMTLHKSKGDEFDYVFIPEMAEKNLTLDFEQIKLKNSDFNENLKRLNPDYKPKTEFDMKQELVSENLRLLYVAITRAKKHLYFSTSRKVKSFEKIIEQEPSLIFTDILDCTEVCDE
ncbi:MAG TPA: ATP-dependent helicase, partial [Candidatus Stercorousia faecigallinarum]|nr:ATP-dependent helicase [Candidatus Stercorousia faecigallinarum]